MQKRQYVIVVTRLLRFSHTSTSGHFPLDHARKAEKLCTGHLLLTTFIFSTPVHVDPVERFISLLSLSLSLSLCFSRNPSQRSHCFWFSLFLNEAQKLDEALPSSSANYTLSTNCFLSIAVLLHYVYHDYYSASYEVYARKAFERQSKGKMSLSWRRGTTLWQSYRLDSHHLIVYN